MGADALGAVGFTIAQHLKIRVEKVSFEKQNYNI
jgi:hypothetical protein